MYVYPKLLHVGKQHMRLIWFILKHVYVDMKTI
jgi:hypothetical protein